MIFLDAMSVPFLYWLIRGVKALEMMIQYEAARWKAGR